MLAYENLRNTLERELWDALDAGDPVGPWEAVDPPAAGNQSEAADPSDDEDPSQAEDVSTGAEWGAARTVRAELLRQLVVLDPRLRAGTARRAWLRGARVTGTLNLGHDKLGSPLVLRNCFFDEEIKLIGASALTIDLQGCHVPKLDADGLTIEGDLRLDNLVTDGVVLTDAHIKRGLSMNGAVLHGRDGKALYADRLKVECAMFCRELWAVGEVRLTGASVAGQLGLEGATLMNPDATALAAEELAVGSMFMTDGFSAEGDVRLIDSNVRGTLDCSGARLINRGGAALQAHRMVVGGACACGDGFLARGSLAMPGARIGGDLRFSKAMVSNPGHCALVLEAVTASSLHLDFAVSPLGDVDLRDARIAHLFDDLLTWPKGLRLAGCTYDSLEVAVKGKERMLAGCERLAWIERDVDGYVPQVYDQLAETFRRAGCDGDARAVGIAKLRRRRGGLTWLGRKWDWALDRTVGYGYNNWLALVWLAVLVVAGSILFAVAEPDHIRATSASAEFEPIVYALDVLLPIVDLGQAGAFTPVGAVRLWYWFSILAGWALATAVVAALAGVLKRD